jgi:mycothiol synthase
MSSPGEALSWRPLDEADLPALTELASVCLAADGGQPFAASPGFLRQCYLAGAESYAGFDAATLVCSSSLRHPPPSAPSDEDRAVPVTTGLVHPAWRRRGLGGHAFDWAAGRAGLGGVRAESEALGEGAHALYLSRGLSQVFAEDVMQRAAFAALPPIGAPRDLVLSQWDQASPARFFTVYESAFRERPQFPGWPQARWVEWITGDEDFRPELTLLATLGGTDVAFIVADAEGWIVQLGVVPQARGKDIGALLITEAVERMRAAGAATITLNVNVNNPHAAALYGRFGFARTGRRARYRAITRCVPASTGARHITGQILHVNGRAHH